MGCARGVNLHQKWPGMNGVQQIECIDAIWKIEQVFTLKLSLYCSLYFGNFSVYASYEQLFSHGHCIGPNCRTQCWNCTLGENRYEIQSNVIADHVRFFSFLSCCKVETLTCYVGSDLVACCDSLTDTDLSRVPPPPW